MFKTALTLSEEQLRRITHYARRRIEGMEAARAGGWISDRERFEREWNDDFSHRSVESTVFARSNESLNMVGSGVDFIRSKILDEIFGSRPWFAVDPVARGEGEAETSEQVVKHLRWKMGPHQIDFEAVASDLVTQACKLGECVAKVFYRTREETVERVARILWDVRANRPVVSAEGEFVFEDDASPAGRELLNRVLEEAAPDAQEWSPGEARLLACGASGEGVLPPGFCWKEQIVSERICQGAGARAIPLHYKEFYCPLHAPSLQEADFVGHLTTMRVSGLAAHLGVVADGNSPGPEGEAYVARALERIRREAGRTVSVAARPMPGEGEEPLVEEDPEFRLLEAYFEYDARGNGETNRIYLLMAYDLDLPIFWDYIANVTPDGRYPFEVVAINKEPHRWYGRSWFKKYETFQRLIDKLLNQILYRNELAANPVKFRRREAVVQWQDDQPLEIGPDRVFDLNDGYSADDALQTARIPELDDQTRYLLETIVSSWRTRSGVTTATQGAFGGLPSEQTATGVTHIIQSGLTIFRPQIMDVKRGLEAVLRQLVAYQYACQTESEAYTYLDGSERVRGTLYPDEVQGLEFNVELTLMRARKNEKLEASRLAVDFFLRFLNIADEYKPVAAPLFEAVYKNLEIDNADDYFRQIAARKPQGGAA